MAFAATPYGRERGMATRSAVRMANGGGSVNSTFKPARSSSSTPSPIRPKPPSPSPSIGSCGRRKPFKSTKGGRYEGGAPGRVRVALRLRPRNAEEIATDMDFADYVELQPEMKILKLRKNNWDCETYHFDDVLTETSSQKRVYEVVAKPVVESVCEGLNGTVMAYGQTGTGKTFTLGCLGDDDTADRGIMVRALEDILENVNSLEDSVTVSYLQLYMEKVQDLLVPEKGNMAIVDDPITGDVSVVGATQVQVKDRRSFVQLLQAGEANRYAANTKLNTESSRSHAVLVVTVKQFVKSKFGDKEVVDMNEIGCCSPQLSERTRARTVRKSKLLVIDLAGSERFEKSGTQGHTLDEAKSINLSLTALGKCINALAENALHVPIRDSKLTRLLRDSFGGTARTSLIVTIGPSPSHRGETASTIAFAQRARKVENKLMLKEESDYKSLCWRLEANLDRLTIENERLDKARQDARDEFEERLEEAEEAVEQRLNSVLKTKAAEVGRLRKELADTVGKLHEAEKALKSMAETHQAQVKERESHHAETLRLQKDLADFTIIRLQNELIQEKREKQKELAKASHRLATERAKRRRVAREVRAETLIMQNESPEKLHCNEVHGLETKLDKATQPTEKLEHQVSSLEIQLGKVQSDKRAKRDGDILTRNGKLDEELEHRKVLEEEVRSLEEQLLLLLSGDGEEDRNVFDKFGFAQNKLKPLPGGCIHEQSDHTREAVNGQTTACAKLFDQVDLHELLSLLVSEDVGVRVHTLKAVAKLAAKEAGREKVVEAGGLSFILMALQSSEDATVCREAARAVANLAVSETNQDRIMAQGGIRLLARTAGITEDPQTLRMVAYALANLCGNANLQVKLREEGAIKAMLGMVRSSPDVLGQVARGIANFARFESSCAAQECKCEKSLLIEDGALPWIVANATNDANPIRRHIQLTLCHLAQHDVNSKDLVASGALLELVRISRGCAREDIRNRAQQILNANNTFQTALQHIQLSLQSLANIFPDREWSQID